MPIYSETVCVVVTIRSFYRSILPVMNGSNDFRIQSDVGDILHTTFPESTGSMPTTSDVNIIPQVSTMEKVLELLILLVIEIVSLVGNLSLWIVILETPSLRTISNGLVLYMSASCLWLSIEFDNLRTKKNLLFFGV